MNSTFIIAEAGVNHNGSIDMAIELIIAAADAGVDAIKFQTFKSEHLVSRFASKADYQTRNTGNDESQLDMLKKLELNADQHMILVEQCNKLRIEFMSTPFDLDSVDFLANIVNVARLKISSGEITNALMLLKAAKTGKPLILSTGMSTLDEVETALGVLAFGFINGKQKPSMEAFIKAYSSDEGQAFLRERVSLLHCTAEYPAPFDEVNLKAMDTLKEHFALAVGYSDHTEGIAVPIAAMARGAVIIEKHFTLDRNLPGPDHKSSLNPVELKQMVTSIRQIEAAMGNGVKQATASEMINIAVARKSLVANRDIKRGELFSEDNISAKRPGSGISPMHYWDIMGRAASRDYAADEMVEL